MARRTVRFRRIIILLMMPSVTVRAASLTVANGFKMFDQNLAPRDQRRAPSNASEMIAFNIYRTMYCRTDSRASRVRSVVIFFHRRGRSHSSRTALRPAGEVEA